MYEMQYINVKVNCPGDPGRVEPMQISLLRTPDGNLPDCNGCESTNGSYPCEQCVKAILTLFSESPYVKTTEPITPKIGESKGRF